MRIVPSVAIGMGRVGRRLSGLVLILWIIAQSSPLSLQGPEQKFQTTERISARETNRKNDRLRRRLIEMGKADQLVRSSQIFAEPITLQAVRKQRSVDRKLTRELQQIVASEGWPTIRSVGAEASEAAALVLIHSEDHAFQRSLLPELQRLAERKEILGANIALITDKVLVSEGKLQRFGTQFRLVGGHLELLPIEDPPALDERRAQYFLPPMAEYRRELAGMYHVPVR